MELAAVSNGLICEHYNSHWQLDMQYNIDKSGELSKPWGFQPGHQVEWTKLLLTLNVEPHNPLWVQRATHPYS